MGLLTIARLSRVKWLFVSLVGPLLLIWSVGQLLGTPFLPAGAANDPIDFTVWDFEDQTIVPSIDLTGNATATHGANLGGEGFPAGNGSDHSWSFNNWAQGDEPDEFRYFAFHVDMSEYEHLRLSFAERRSSTGPLHFEIHYSIDGENFILITETVTTIPNNTSWRSHYFDFGLGTPLDEVLRGQPDAQFRIYGYGASNTVGTWRIDDVTFTANPLADPLPPAPEADLVLHKSGPDTAVAGQTISYLLSFNNSGALTATGVILTDSLPAGLNYQSDSGGYPFQQPAPGTLVWQIGSLPPAASASFYLTAAIAPNLYGAVVNEAWITTEVTETNLANNYSSVATFITDGGEPAVLIDAVHYRGYELGQTDEAVRLINAGSGAANIGGWQLSKGSSPIAVLPPDVLLFPQETVWLARNGLAFQRQFGYLPDFEVNDTHPDIPKLLGGWPQFPDNGGLVILLDETNEIIDLMVYENGDTNQGNQWSGPAVQPYTAGSLFGRQGQILYRLRDPATGRPVPDTNSAADWAASLDDPIHGRKVQYPGWRLDDFFFPMQVTETAVLTVAIAPDNAFEAIVQEINAAQERIEIQSMTFENIAIAEALIQAAQRGVSVTILLEGNPPGGMADQQRYVCQQIEAVGQQAQCWFMINEPDERIYDRYRFLHAKYILIDGRLVIVSSENLSPNSLPNDDKEDGTWGRRGVVLLTDAAGVVAYIQSLFQADFNPDAHVDLLRWQADHPLYGDKYGAPPSHFVPITQTGGVTYAVRFAAPVGYHGHFPFEIVHAPENSLRAQDGLLGLINRAGAGDTLLVQQLNERPYWGPSSSNPDDDPNPRLEAYINAGRRGATVRLLLDEYFDSRSNPTSNHAACQRVNSVAWAENLDMHCALNNPTGLGIHNKMVLVEIDGRGYIHIGSLNGSENASKGNRELALQVQSDDAYDLLARMFFFDWPHRVYLPLAMNNYIPPADHILISEVLYDPWGPDDSEFIELVNPTHRPIDISGYRIGDAAHPDDFEDMRIFPEGTIMQPHQTLVIAFASTAFEDMFGFKPDFEIWPSDESVPVLAKDPNWGHPNGLLQLANHGDEVLLMDPDYNLIDIVVYGAGYYPGVVPCDLVSAPQRSLERYPYWRNTGHCPTDFREWPFPNPGQLPP